MPETETTEIVENQPLSIFVPLLKVDYEKREVYGWATVEEPDHAGEIMDYASSKEHFLKWSEAAKSRSGGKSLGNVRAMHSNIAAGKLVQMSPDDARKGVFVGAKITNNDIWEQVLEGVFTGFSIGGKYLKKWWDKGFMRFTAEPHEISVVDAPAVPSATFQLVKSDGSIEDREFKKADLPPTPSASMMPVEELRIAKDQATFSTLNININLNGASANAGAVPSTDQLITAGVPAQQSVSMPVTGSAATDTGPAAAGQNEAAYKADQPLGENPMTEEMNKAGSSPTSTSFDPKTLIDTVRANMSTNPDVASAALDQLQGAYGAGVVHAPLAQDGTMAVDASSAGGMMGTSVSSAGPTIQAEKSADPSVPAGGNTTTGASSTSSTPSSSSSTSKDDAVSGPSSFDMASAGGTGMGDKTTPPAAPASSVPTSSTSVTKSETVDPAQEFLSELKKSLGDTTMSDNPSTPMTTTPPMPNYVISGNSVTDQHLPAFITALEGGSLKKAQQVVRDLNGGSFDQFIFDEMVVKAQKRLMEEGGWTYNNLTKGALSRGMGFMPSDDMALKKAIQIGDIPNIYLIRLVKLMLPLYAGLRRRLPANPPATGADKAQWRAELGTSNFNFATAMSVAEASTGQAISESFLTFVSPFMRIALNDAVTLEAVYGTRGFDDPLQIAVVRALTLLLGTEERKILGDNSGSLAAPSSLTATSSSTGGTLAAATYTIRVSALTYRGWLAKSTGGSAPVGETTTGSTQVITSGSTSQITNVTWAAVPGAVAYNLYLDNGTNNRYVATYTINKSGAITAMPGSGGSSPASDTSANANGYEGILSWAAKSTVYGNAIPNKTFTDQAGSGLTTYAGGITEFDTLLANLWTNWQVAPSLILTSPNGAKHLTKQILSTSNTSGYRIEVGQERGTISGGVFVTGYTNKFAPYADGTPRVIDIMAHPYVADGTFSFLTESITYPMAREARGFVLETLIPYTYFPLAQTTIQYPFSMLVSETLECFHPGAQAQIAGVDITQ